MAPCQQHVGIEYPQNHLKTSVLLTFGQLKSKLLLCTHSYYSGEILSRELLIELTYQPDLHNHYKTLSQLPGFALLESRDQQRGRYDIVTASPYETISVPPHSKNQKELLDYLRELIQPQTTKYNLPFQGGAIGYVSYDFGAQQYGIHSQPQSSLQSMPLLHLGLYDWAIIADHHLRKVTLYVGNQHASTTDSIKDIIDLWNHPDSTQITFKMTQELSPLMSREHYEYAFAEIQKALREGRSYQVNFTQPFHVHYEGDPWAIYQKISRQNPVPYSAYLSNEHDDILSFSPERFLLYEQGNLLTSPIKGTIHRSNNAVEDAQLKQELFTSAKNRAENVMIVDLLRNDLAKISQPGSVEVLKLCEVQSFNGVHHLVSDIRAKSQPLNPTDLFLSCFPGGSITGAPKLESMRIINELELFARGVYCGSVVYFSRHGRFDSNIAIRTAIAKHNILHLAAGGGLVIDSECEDEYRECFIKLKAIINGLR